MLLMAADADDELLAYDFAGSYSERGKAILSKMPMR